MHSARGLPIIGPGPETDFQHSLRGEPGWGGAPLFDIGTGRAGLQQARAKTMVAWALGILRLRWHAETAIRGRLRWNRLQRLAGTTGLADGARRPGRSNRKNRG